MNSVYTRLFNIELLCKKLNDAIKKIIKTEKVKGSINEKRKGNGI